GAGRDQRYDQGQAVPLQAGQGRGLAPRTKETSRECQRPGGPAPVADAPGSSERDRLVPASSPGTPADDTLRISARAKGPLAKRQGNGLQIRDPRFKSGRGLFKRKSRSLNGLRLFLFHRREAPERAVPPMSLHDASSLHLPQKLGDVQPCERRV